MRFFPLVFFCLLFACPPAAHAAELRIAFGLTDVVPRQAEASGKGSGQGGGLVAFNEDLAREICRWLNTRCVMVHVLFADILPGIEEKKFELGFGNFLRTPEREKRVAFSDAIWRSSSRLVGTPKTARRFAARLGHEPELGNLRRARLAVVGETQQHRYLDSIAGEQELTVLTATTMGGMLALLREGKADFGLLPTLSAYTMLNREPADRFEFVGPPLVDAGLGGTVHIALPIADADLRQRVNQAIAALRADGSFHRIVRRHFPFSVD